MDVRGRALLGPQQRDSSEFTFYLSPHIPDPQFRLHCGGRRLPLVGVTHEAESGDRKFTLRSRRPCRAGNRLALRFGYFIPRVELPQMRITDRWGFAGGGGELWYPQRSFAERQVSQIDLEVPAAAVAIASGAQARIRRRGNRSSHRFVSHTPGKLAFAYGPYASALLPGAPIVRVLSRGTSVEATQLVSSLRPAIDSLARTFGRPPFDTLALVEVDFPGLARGSSEYGMIFAEPARMRGPFDLPYWAHEFGHQWWGNLVRAQSGTGGAALLTEGMAQYGALVALEAVAGAAAAAEYRRGDSDARAHSIAAYRRLLAAGRDRAPATFRPAGQEQIIDGHRLATTKGAIVLRYLAELVGKDRFHAILQDFLRRGAGRAASWADLEAAIDRATSGEYRWFLEQWLHRPGAPAILLGYCATGTQLRGEIRQEGTPYRLPLVIEVAGSWGASRFPVLAQGARTSFAFDVPGRVERLILDPDALVPTSSATVQQTGSGRCTR